MKLILFGAGNRLQKSLKSCSAYGHTVLAITDNDTNKQGETIPWHKQQIPIIPPEQIIQYNFDAVVLTTQNNVYLTEIAQQLQTLGIPYEKMATLMLTGDLSYFPEILSIDPSSVNVPSIYYDMSAISNHDSGTGIQRVVNHLFGHLAKLHTNIIPSRMFLGQYITSRKIQAAIARMTYDNKERHICFAGGGKIIFPDGTWLIDYKKLFAELKENAIKTYVIMHDIMPIVQKHLFPESLPIFQPYVDFILNEADSLICISQTVANDIVNYSKESYMSRKSPLPLYIFHEGFDIGNSTGHIRQELRNFIKKDKTLLTVGAMRPHKNHILTAKTVFDIMQNNRDFDGNLLFIGRQVKEEQKQFEAMVGEAVDRILWIEDAADNELCYAYENAKALVFATSSEGFGLPLVEAAHFGLPILASNIPIFREIAGDNILYFEPNDAESLKETILRYWHGETPAPDSKNIRLYTWEESAREILAILEEKSTPYRILE